MAIIDIAREDWARLNDEVELILCAPTGERAVFMGIGTANFITETLTDGQEAIANDVHISFSESVLLAANPTYPIRDNEKNITLKGHRVSFKDSGGNLKDWAVKIVFPDNTVGVIAAKCEKYKPISS